MTEQKTPFWVRCEACGHCWIALYTPMPMRAAGQLLKQTRCPRCAGPKRRIVIAKQKKGVLQELTP